MQTMQGICMNACAHARTHTHKPPPIPFSPKDEGSVYLWNINNTSHFHTMQMPKGGSTSTMNHFGTLKLVLQSMLHVTSVYCIEIWNFCHCGGKMEIEMFEKRVLRKIFGLKWNEITCCITIGYFLINITITNQWRRLSHGFSYSKKKWHSRTPIIQIN
jgi:hypothetical protein